MPIFRGRLLSARVPAVVGALVVGSVALFGCSNGFQANDTVGRLRPPGTEAPLTGGGSAAALPPDVGTQTPVTTVPAPAGNPANPATPASSAFCRDVADIQGLIGVLLQPGVTAGAAKQAQDLVRRLTADSPPELKSAVAVLVQIESRVIADLSASPPNLADVTAAIASPSYRQALQQVLIYAAQNCSIKLVPPSP